MPPGRAPRLHERQAQLGGVEVGLGAPHHVGVSGVALGQPLQLPLDFPHLRSLIRKGAVRSIELLPQGFDHVIQVRIASGGRHTRLRGYLQDFPVSVDVLLPLLFQGFDLQPRVADRFLRPVDLLCPTVVGVSLLLGLVDPDHLDSGGFLDDVEASLARRAGSPLVARNGRKLGKPVLSRSKVLLQPRQLVILGRYASLQSLAVIDASIGRVVLLQALGVRADRGVLLLVALLAHHLRPRLLLEQVVAGVVAEHHHRLERLHRAVQVRLQGLAQLDLRGGHRVGRVGLVVRPASSVNVTLGLGDGHLVAVPVPSHGPPILRSGLAPVKRHARGRDGLLPQVLLGPEPGRGVVAGILPPARALAVDPGRHHHAVFVEFLRRHGLEHLGAQVPHDVVALAHALQRLHEAVPQQVVRNVARQYPAPRRPGLRALFLEQIGLDHDRVRERVGRRPLLVHRPARGPRKRPVGTRELRLGLGRVPVGREQARVDRRVLERVGLASREHAQGPEDGCLARPVRTRDARHASEFDPELPERAPPDVLDAKLHFAVPPSPRRTRPRTAST